MTPSASLRNFIADPEPHLQRLRASGEPERLEVEGGAIVVQDEAAYEALLDKIEMAEALAGIQAGRADFAAGRTMSVAQLREEMRRRVDELSR